LVGFRQSSFSPLSPLHLLLERTREAMILQVCFNSNEDLFLLKRLQHAPRKEDERGEDFIVG